jgi:dTDP-4-amino-4,6-dideoxygalactose transaminase
VSNFFHDGLPIIEDAAQSFGASVNGVKSGKLGDVSCLSFDPTKNLPNYGSGGMILTDDDNLYKSVLNLRDNGKASGHGVLGTNSKMSEQDCAQMLVKMQYFDAWQARRKGIANYYTEQLQSLVGTPIVAANVEHAWHKYVIKTPDQYRLREHLDAQGIQTKIHYETPLPHHPIFSGYGDDENFPRALAMSQQAVSLPIYPEMTDLEVDQVVTSIASFYR